MFKKIVIGFDGSETSERALIMACDLAKKYGAELHLVHTPQPHTVAFALGAIAGYRMVTTMPSHEEVDDASDKIVASATAIAAACDQKFAQTHVEIGDPADIIAGYAKSCGADLIITGRRGLGAIGAFVQGSTSQRINHLAKCASMSVI